MGFGSLWLQVIAASVAVFVVSSILHMALKYHRADYKSLPNEEAVRDALGKGSLPPGLYQLPYCVDAKQMKEPAHLAKYEKGPVAMITVIANGMPSMGKYLGLWFGYCLLISFTAAYTARISLHPGDNPMMAMRVTGTVAFVGYGLANIVDSIWKGQPWSNTTRSIIDGVIYSVTTGAVFCFMWPK